MSQTLRLKAHKSLGLFFDDVLQLSLSMSFSLSLSLWLSFCWSCHISSSLWSKVPKVTSVCHCLCFGILVGQVMSPRHSHHMSQGTKVSRITLWGCSLNVFVIFFVFVFVIVIVIVFVFVIVFLIVRSCLLISLIKCLKCQKSLRLGRGSKKNVPFSSLLLLRGGGRRRCEKLLSFFIN